MVDATNVQPEWRKSLIALARKWHALAVAVVFDLPEAVAVARNAARPDRQFHQCVVAVLAMKSEPVDPQL